jgi:hypothetical protein
VLGDSQAAALSTQPGLSTTASAQPVAGSYSIIASGAASQLGYGLTYQTGTLTVVPAALTVVADNQSKVYGAALPGLTAHATGLVNGDTASLITGLTTTATAASAYTIDASGASAGANYTIVSATNGTLSVTPALLTVVADNQSKVYGAALPGLTAMPRGWSTAIRLRWSLG